MQLLTVQAEMSDGARRTIAVVLPDCSSGSHVYAETSRRLRERFKAPGYVVEYRVIRRAPTGLPAFCG